MTSALLGRTVVALLVAGAATALSLLAVVWMSADAAPPPAQARAQAVVFDIAAPPPDELPAEPVPELPTPPPTPAQATTTAAQTAPPRSASALAPGPSAGAVPSAIGGLPLLGSGFGAPPGAPALPADAEGPAETPAKPLSRPAPRYPRQAQQAGVEGYVIVRLRVDERGRVSDVVVIEGSPEGVFDDVATQTARTYRFSPARRGGKAVATTVQQRIVFRLDR